MIKAVHRFTQKHHKTQKKPTPKHIVNKTTI